MERVNDISKSKTLYVVVIIFLMAALVITVVTAVSLGQVNIKVSDTYKIILGKLIHNDEIYNSFSKAMIAIVWNMRLPRVLLGLLAGAGLALCGCVMQATVNNPISEPYIQYDSWAQCRRRQPYPCGTDSGCPHRSGHNRCSTESKWSA